MPTLVGSIPTVNWGYYDGDTCGLYFIPSVICMKLDQKKS